MKLSLLMILFAASLHAATITLTWNASDSSTPQDPGTVNVYRVTATQCPPATNTTGVVWIKLATRVNPDGPYIDSAASSRYGHCYYVTQVDGDGTESEPSNMFFVPAAPASLQGAWQP